MTTVDLLTGHSGEECVLSAQGWLSWSNRLGKQPAMIDLWPDYFESIGPKARNMIRKADRKGYYFGVFDYNGFLDDMHEVNTSLSMRGGQPMAQSYTDRPRPNLGSWPKCSRHTVLWIGGFNDGRLKAYCQLYVCGELAIINRILGHGDCLKDGVMNGLIFHVVQAADAHQARWLNYLTMESSTPGIQAFKRHVGFRPTEVEFIA